jgi:nucleoside 2-deoxyribosyltransferase
VNTPPRVFLSFASEDQAAAEELQRELYVQGVHARSDADMRPGTDWGAHLREAMDNADAVVFMVTSAAVASANVMTEIGAAIASGKPVIPVVPANGRLPAGLPAALRKWHFVRAGKRDATEVAAEIRDRLASPVVA